MNPETRGRTSTEWMASKWPVNSSQSVTWRLTAGATVTSGADATGAGFAQAWARVRMAAARLVIRSALCLISRSSERSLWVVPIGNIAMLLTSNIEVKGASNRHEEEHRAMSKDLAPRERIL